MKRWTCGICGYIYDEGKEGTAFEDLPDTWACPLCGADKAAFTPDGKQGSAPAPAAVPVAEGMKQLSAGELSAVCSNLARGCEKQYKEQEAALFRTLADFFAAAAPEIPGGTLTELAAGLQEDLETGYPALRAAAEAASDRGTQRICVWGEKVTDILSAVIRRFQKEGEAFLQDTQIWVCTVCGFLYVGGQAPELCPVCKVPAWKFEKIEGRS